MDISSSMHLSMISVYIQSSVYCVFFRMLSKLMMTAQLQLRAFQPPEHNTHVQE